MVSNSRTKLGRERTRLLLEERDFVTLGAASGKRADLLKQWYTSWSRDPMLEVSSDSLLEIKGFLSEEGWIIFENIYFSKWSPRSRPSVSEWVDRTMRNSLWFISVLCVFVLGLLDVSAGHAGQFWIVDFEAIDLAIQCCNGVSTFPYELNARNRL